MLRDVFYYGQKPNVHPREKPAKNLEDARNQATTEHFWIVNEFCDYRNFDWDFDFDFLPDDQVWTGEHDNVWPSQHNKDSGTWLCSKNTGGNTIYRQDVPVLIRTSYRSDNWILNYDVDEALFDFSWHPDPTDPPYIYAWSCRYFPATHKPAIEYHVPGATNYKYMEKFVELAKNKNNFKILHEVDENSFDWAWIPDPTHPPYIYVWGNQHYPAEEMPTVEYHVEGATERKYIDKVWHAKLKSKPELFEVFEECTNVDYTWRPNPGAPPYIYAWGNQWNKPEDKISVQFVVEGATEYKYMANRVTRKPCKDNWLVPKNIDTTKFDFSWVPNPNDPPFIYRFGTQWQKTGGPTYIVEGASEIKYIEGSKAKALPDKDDPHWVIPENVDTTDFDFSWHPDTTERPYIYQFGTQWQKTDGPRYVMPGATNVKYIEENKAKALPTGENWDIPDGIDLDSFDFSWHPDSTVEKPYIYQFGTQWQETGGPKYVVPGATDIKYVKEQKATILSNEISSNWTIPAGVDTTNFDFSWHPDEKDSPYIYQFGTQHQKTGGPIYTVTGASEVKFVSFQKVKKLPNITNWEILEGVDITNFDFSWHPDDTDPPYIYVFGNQWYDAEIEPTLEYIVPGATQIKYVNDLKAILLPDKSNWTILHSIDETKFDFSWRPNPNDPPYIYIFGNQYYSAEIMPTVEYHTPGAVDKKYIPNIIAHVLNDKNNWIIPDNINVNGFDFNWIPNPHDPPYIYEFNTQWQKNGGPKYFVSGATEVKYMTSNKVKSLPTTKNWQVESNLKIKYFDFSWHPDNTEKPYIYVFGNNQYPGEIMPTIRYVMPNATEIKYVKNNSAILDIDMNNWYIPNNVDIKSFDFSWIPDPTSPPYIYEFATVWNDRGGPIYTVPGASEKKYITDIQAKLKPNKTNWHINIKLEPDSFDFSWTPHPEAPPYIYVFGNQWNTAEKESTVEYRVPGAIEYKYVNDIVAKVAQDKSKFKIIHKIVDGSFDFSWRPDPYDPPYIYRFGNTQYSAELMPTIEYHMSDATEIKYIDIIVAKLAPNMTYWVEKLPIDKNKFDFGWVPDPKSPPYIYVFGSQWNPSNIEHALEYHVPGSTEYKYIDNIVAPLLSNKKNFYILHPIIENSFDFSWRPNPTDPPYIYVFGNTQYSAEKMPTIEYRVEGAIEYKYMNNLTATLAQNYSKFNELIPIDRTSFDYSWTPDPYDPPYIYVWGNQWYGPEIEPTIEYRVPGATELKFMEHRPKVLPDFDKWKELIKVKRNFDFSWRPNPTSPPYIYVFGNQWNKAEIEPTLEYHTKNATDKKYVNDIIAEAEIDKTNWIIKDHINVDDFDFSWRPDPGAPPYIYQFGTLIDDNDGPMYVHPKNSGEVVRLLRVNKKNEEEFLEIPKYYIISTLEELIEEHDDELFWALNKNINYSNFNFNWRPNIEQARYVHVFGSPEAKETQTYFVNSKLYKQGFTQYNFVTEDVKVENEYLAELFIQPDIFFIDRGNFESKERYENLKKRFPNIQKTRYLNSWVDTIYRCLSKCETQLAWILNSELDYTDFDFKYYPNPWQMKMVHVFGTQWSHWGTTYLVNKDTFPEDTKYVKVIEHLHNLNFVKGKIAKATNSLYDVYLIDHGNIELETIKEQLSSKIVGKSLTVVPYSSSYLETIKSIISNINPYKEHYIWIVNSVCDYNNFDLSYICDPFAKDNLHVFPSDNQKFGDTFLIDVNKFKNLMNDMNLLEDYDKVNYNGHLRARRIPAPVIIQETEVHQNIKNLDFKFPYAILKTKDNSNLNVDYREPLCLWANHTKNIEILSTGGTTVVLPIEAKEYIHSELYDYPYITKSKNLAKSKPLDIVYLSNGEKCADENYEYLLKVAKNLPNRIVRVDGVNGRVQAYHAAAEASDTPWMFTVFAKLKVNEKFDWSWQPDRLQIAKHYIFNAKNPVNGLVYGHQAMIAYNKRLVLNNTGRGLDFTLDDEHEVVDMISGIANFNTDPFSTWRTAFREVIKLKSDYKEISNERLTTWLNVAEGQYAQDCLQGARDGVEYYDSVHGDIDQLKLSYEWNWLRDYYNKKYK